MNRADEAQKLEDEVVVLKKEAAERQAELERRRSGQMLKATVPHSEMLRYAIDLRSITRGRGTFRTDMSHYEEVPAHVAQNIIANHKKEREAGEHD